MIVALARRLPTRLELFQPHEKVAGLELGMNKPQVALEHALAGFAAKDERLDL